MKRKVVMRQAIFETNSSSMHTFAISNASDYTKDREINQYLRQFSDEELLKEEDGSFYLPLNSDYKNYSTEYENSFEKDFQILDKWIDKLRYCAAYYGINEIETLINVIQKRLPLCKGLIASYDYISFQINDEDSLNLDAPFYPQYLEDYFGTIDHQSFSNITEALCAMNDMPEYSNMNEEEKIYEIIFSNKILIVIDSDETCTLDNYIRENIIDSTKFEKILSCSYKDDENIFIYKFTSVEDYLKRNDD